MTKGALIFLVLLIGVADGSQLEHAPVKPEVSLPEAKILKASSDHVTTVPTFSAFLPVQCDGAGNLYFHLNRGNASYNQGVVMRVELDSDTPTLYKLQSNMEGNTDLAEYNVTPSGKVSFLTQSDDGLGIFTFDSDGNVESKVQLSDSKFVEPQNFTVSERGAALISGYYNKHANAQIQGKPFAGIFDQGGKLRRDLGSGADERVDLSTISKSLSDRGATVGADGNFYLLHSDEILVLAENGDVLRKIEIDRPQAHAISRQIVESEGLISITFRKPDTHGAVVPEYLVLDAGTGAEFGLYEPSPELGNNCVCFSRRKGFEFYRVEQGYVKLVNAALR